MEFYDNGEGIRRETVDRLNEEMQEMRENLLLRHQIVEMESGGMGLLNTYARLVLFFGRDVGFEISGSGEGTKVVITAPWICLLYTSRCV